MTESSSDIPHGHTKESPNSSGDSDINNEEPQRPYGPLLRREPYQRRRVREHLAPDVNDVVDTIDPRDLTGCTPEERAKKIISWLNWNLRMNEFAPDFRSWIWWEANGVMEANQRWSEVPGAASLAWPTA